MKITRKVNTGRFYNERRNKSLSEVSRLRESGATKIKSANIKHLTRGNYVLAISSDLTQYAFSISKLKGYSGEDPSSVGLKVGADVKIEVEDGEVKAVEIAG